MLDSEDRDERIEVNELAALADSVLKMREDSSARQIIGQVRAAVESWPAFAAEAEVSDEFATKIGTFARHA